MVVKVMYYSRYKWKGGRGQGYYGEKKLEKEVIFKVCQMRIMKGKWKKGGEETFLKDS